ncbi:elongator complex protein 5 isoform X2 [Mastacembelus armatus]|uniref:elongator complex protein 5 isoform X2 n=1 Tax=Mastacembelus armatus TaxID=205130 RepID=UPI000E45E7DA|nr:elongator complex protein 5 isoform X2 [Mastacembelus armatus]
MLPELLQGSDAGGFLIIQDSAGCSGRHLLKSFINAALNREEAVHVLGFEISEEELKEELKGSLTQRLHFHDAFTDPLGWTDHPAFTVHQFGLEELTRLVKHTSHAKPAILVIDSLSWILRHVSPPVVCRTLQQLKKGGAVRAIIGLLHADMHQRGAVGSVCHLATSVITVAPRMTGDEALAKITKRSKSGKVVQDEEIFSIKEDLTVIVMSKPSHTGLKLTDPENQESVRRRTNLLFPLSSAKRRKQLCSTQGRVQDEFCMNLM